ncbi:MAG: (2Fe-2S)-binding protein [Deltaproteobacteria bacterium]|nr:(2Fe-2S)-binding protein [Deltaproteobacteria bacterium]
MTTRETLPVHVRVNGVEYGRAVESRLVLSDFLRDTLGLTGTHVGCEHGICGACTVMLDGQPVRSCLIFAVQADGAAVTTIEGLAEGGKLHPLQEAFSEHHGLQCGFCTPGMLFSALELLRDNPRPTDREIREGIAGNICRCTGYQHIVDAVRAASPHIARGPK